MNNVTTTSRRPRRGTTVTRWVALGLLASTLWALGAAPASAADQRAAAKRVTFGIEPAGPSGADGRPAFLLGATPGAVLFDHVALLNYSSVALPLSLSSADATESDSGGFDLSTGRVHTGVGSWISLPSNPLSVLVPPEKGGKPGQYVVAFSMRVPLGAGPGDHAGGLVASLTSVGTSKSGQRIVLVQRVGTRVFVRVAGALRASLAIRNLSVSYAGTLNPFAKGSATLDYDIANTGNVDVGVSSRAWISELVAAPPAVRAPAIPLLLAGTSVHEHVVVHGVWPQFVIEGHADARALGANGAVIASVAAASASSWALAIPWTALAIILALIVMSLYASRRARRAQNDAQPKDAGEQPQHEDVSA